MLKKVLNKLKKRDKKRNPHKMRVDPSGKRLAQIKLRKRTEIGTDNIWPGIGMPKLPRESSPRLKKKKRLGERRKLRRVDDRGLPAKKVIERRTIPERALYDPEAEFWVSAKEVAAPYIEEVRQAAQVPEDPLKKMVKEGRLHQVDLDAYLER